MGGIIGIIGALAEEVAPYARDMTDKTVSSRYGFNFFEGELEGHRIVAVECGTGKTNSSFASAILLHQYDPAAVVVSGVCGSIDASLRVLDTVVSERVAHHDVAPYFMIHYRPFLPDVWFLADERLLGAARRGADGKGYGSSVRFGKIVTGEAFIEEAGRGAIIDTFDPMCVDMESACAAQIAYCAGVPYIAVRTVTDTEEDSGVETFRLNCVRASEKSYDVVCAMLREL